MSTCRSCEAEVLFVPSAKTGKPMILDAEPNPVGNVLIRAGVAAVISRQVVAREDEQRWMPHHATCPAAASWKGRVRSDPPGGPKGP